MAPKPPDRPTVAARSKRELLLPPGLPTTTPATVVLPPKPKPVAPVSLINVLSSVKFAFKPPPRSSVPRMPQRDVASWPASMPVRAPPVVVCLVVYVTAASTMPYSVTELCARAEVVETSANTAPATRVNFFMKSPRVLDGVKCQSSGAKKSALGEIDRCEIKVYANARKAWFSLETSLALHG